MFTQLIHWSVMYKAPIGDQNKGSYVFVLWEMSVCDLCGLCIWMIDLEDWTCVRCLHSHTNTSGVPLI